MTASCSNVCRALMLQRWPSIAVTSSDAVPRCTASTLRSLASRPHSHRSASHPVVPARQVVVPKTYHELTSRRVLTAEWIEGEKLSQSDASDVGDLVNVGVISYLQQLLDTGEGLHIFGAVRCHPTQDQGLCIQSDCFSCLSRGHAAPVRCHIR